MERISAHTIWNQPLPVLDVRSPGEYNHAHIPGAYSLPLFTDEERAIVGTSYKRQGRQQAIFKALGFFKMQEMVKQADKLLAPYKQKNAPTEVLVHCWRGGMRSAAVAWLLELYGYKVQVLEGGYKAFRQQVLQAFEKPYAIRIVGGYTGSGKTEILTELHKRGEQIIDIEALAGHRGSAFGGIGRPPQPTQEMFENTLALHLMQSDAQKSIWIEDESQRIGVLNIPHTLWKTMRNSPVYFIDLPFEVRLSHIVASYGSLNREKLIEAVLRIQKRLGPLETKISTEHLQSGNIREAFSLLLKYYDKFYLKGLHNRSNVAQQVTTFPCTTVTNELIHQILNACTNVKYG